jgi:lipopolysaccharide transport system permease protein
MDLDTGSVGVSGSTRQLTQDIARLWHHRRLVALWLKYNIRMRYSQSILGILWILLIPLSTALIMALVFTYFLRVQFSIPFIVFFLPALVVYNIFSQGVTRSTVAVLANMGLINQVAFPREILVLVALGEVLIDFGFTFVAVVVVNAFYGVWPNVLYIFLVPILLILCCFTLGLMFFVSYLSVLIRDVPQLVGISLQMFFYLTPILYGLENVPAKVVPFLKINPIAPLIEATRDIISLSTMPDLSSLLLPAILSMITLVLGYRAFKANDTLLADIV